MTIIIKNNTTYNVEYKGGTAYNKQLMNTEPPTPAAEYFYVEDISGAANTLSIVKNNASAPTIEVFKSTNMNTWESMGNTDTTAITATVPANSKLYLKAVCDRWGNSNYNSISCSGNYNIGGNSMSLLYGDNFDSQTTFTTNNTYVFASLFRNDTHLKNAEDLELPATTLANYCYQYMFYGCTALATAPALPAITLTQNCYQYMFQNCTALTTAPVLPATTLATECYSNMFKGCTSLTTAPNLPSTSNSGSFARLYEAMFSGCTSLLIAPKINLQRVTYAACRNMFSGCTSLTTALGIPNATFDRYACSAMFYGCTNLNSVTTYNTAYNSENFGNWLYGVAAQGDFWNLGNASYPEGASGIPSGWTEHTSL